MRYWCIGCWHSGDTDGGHEYSTTAPSVAVAATRLFKMLGPEAVASITFLEFSGDVVGRNCVPI